MKSETISEGTRPARDAQQGRAAWLIAGLILCAGWYVANARYERPIALANAASETLYRNTVRNERILAQAPALHRVRAAALRALGHYAIDVPNADGAAFMVDTLARCTAGINVRVATLDPGPTGGPATTARANVPAVIAGLTPAAITLGVRGSFIDVVRFVQRLSRQRTPVEVQSVSVVRLDANGRIPQVEASIAAVTYRISPISRKVSHVTAH